MSRFRDYSYLGITQSLCPECYGVVPAKIISRRGRVYFQKKCPEHGEREDFICSDVRRYDRLETSLPAKLPERVFSAAKHGCPLDCGLCEAHEQHTCVAVIEISDGCNLTCPMCYAGSGPGQKHKSLEEIKRSIDRIVEAEGQAEVIQLSGGEPTLHPDLLEAVEYAFQADVDYLMINTNGVRFAHDAELVEKLSSYKDKLEIYFQFDSLDDNQIQQLRGQAGLLEIKLKALERLESVGLNVTLVATLQGGVNDSAPADLLEFARKNPFVTGLSFQPATYSGRHVLPGDLEQRITFPDVVDCLADDPRNSFNESDFMPLPCAHPNCHWMTLAVRDDERLLPVTKAISASDNFDLLANGISFTPEKARRLAEQLVNRLACGPGCDCSEEEANEPMLIDSLTSFGNNFATDERSIWEFLQKVLSGQATSRDMVRITITSFLDVYNFDVRRVMKCCTHHVLPSGHIIPFCAYNVLYRDGRVALPQLIDDVSKQVQP